MASQWFEIPALSSTCCETNDQLQGERESSNQCSAKMRNSCYDIRLI